VASTTTGQETPEPAKPDKEVGKPQDAKTSGGSYSDALAKRDIFTLTEDSLKSLVTSVANSVKEELKQAVIDEPVEKPEYYYNEASKLASLEYEEDAVQNTGYNAIIALLSLQQGNSRFLKFDKQASRAGQEKMQNFIATYWIGLCNKIAPTNTFGSEKDEYQIAIQYANLYFASILWRVVCSKEIFRPKKLMKLDSRKKMKSTRRTPASAYRSYLLSIGMTEKASIGWEYAMRCAALNSIRKSLENEKEYLAIYSKRTDLTPSIVDMEAAGEVPDVDIRNYENIYTTKEWDEIKEAGLLVPYQRLCDLRKRKGLKGLELFNALGTIRRLEQTKKLHRLKKNRSQRLYQLASIKSDSKQFKAHTLVGEYFHKRAVQSAFCPSTVLEVCCDFKGASSSELISMLTRKEREDGSIYWEPNERFVDERVFSPFVISLADFLSVKSERVLRVKRV
jgi:hypothetical protein